MKDKYRLLLKDTAVFAIGSLGSKIILFFLVPLYTNFLTTEEYGIADLISTLSTLIIPFVSLSIDKAVLRYGMKKEELREDVLKCAFLILGLSMIFTAVALPFMGLYKPASEWKYYLAVQIVISNIAEVEKAYLKVKNKNKALSIIGILNTAILTSMNIVLLTVFRLGISGYLMSNIVAQLVCVFVCFFVAGIPGDLKRGVIRKPLFKNMVSYAAPLILSGISWCVLHSSDKIMIEWIIGPASLGVYTAATKIPSLINVITGIFNQAWGLSTIREYEATRGSGFYALIFDIFEVILFVAGIIFISISRPFMYIYVGEEFRDAWMYTPYLFVSAIFYSLFSFLGSIYLALQKSKNDMWTSILCAGLNVIINFFGIKCFGVGGAVLGTVVSYFVFTVVRLIDIKKLIAFNIKLRLLIINSMLVIFVASAITFDKCIPLTITVCYIVFLINNYTMFRTVVLFGRERLMKLKRK